jgi:hypothetical protein
MVMSDAACGVCESDATGTGFFTEREHATPEARSMAARTRARSILRRTPTDRRITLVFAAIV